MDLYEKQLLEALRDLGGTGSQESIMAKAYFPNASLSTASSALLQSGAVEAIAYNGNNPMQGWSELSITGAGRSVLGSL